MTALINKATQLNNSTEAILAKNTSDTGRTVHSDRATNYY